MGGNLFGTGSGFEAATRAAGSCKSCASGLCLWTLHTYSQRDLEKALGLHWFCTGEHSDDAPRPHAHRAQLRQPLRSGTQSPARGISSRYLVPPPEGSTSPWQCRGIGSLPQLAACLHWTAARGVSVAFHQQGHHQQRPCPAVLSAAQAAPGIVCPVLVPAVQNRRGHAGEVTKMIQGPGGCHVSKG